MNGIWKVKSSPRALSVARNSTTRQLRPTILRHSITKPMPEVFRTQLFFTARMRHESSQSITASLSAYDSPPEGGHRGSVAGWGGAERTNPGTRRRRVCLVSVPPPPDAETFDSFWMRHVPQQLPVNTRSQVTTSNHADQRKRLWPVPAGIKDGPVTNDGPPTQLRVREFCLFDGISRIHQYRHHCLSRYLST